MSYTDYASMTPNAQAGINSPSGSTSNSGSLLGLGELGVGAAGLGLLLGEGESPLPSEFGQLTANVPTLENDSSTLFNQGQTFTNQGAQALNMAQNGQLTPQQQAQLAVYQGGLQNTAAQEYATMGRNSNQDTSFVSTQANIDTQVNAMAQQEIQSTIALGLGETSAGSNFSGQALGYENAANSALIAAGNAQLQQDKDYSSSLTGAFTAVASIAGSVAKAI
jgi:hypothetical protein